MPTIKSTSSLPEVNKMLKDGFKVISTDTVDRFKKVDGNEERAGYDIVYTLQKGDLPLYRKVGKWFTKLL